MGIIKNDIPILEFDTEQKAVISPVHENLNLALPKKCVFAFLGNYIDEYAYKTDAIAARNRRTIVPGDILDCNGALLVENKKIGEPGDYADDYAYSQVLGYLQNGGYRFKKKEENKLQVV